MFSFVGPVCAASVGKGTHYLEQMSINQHISAIASKRAALLAIAIIVGIISLQAGAPGYGYTQRRNIGEPISAQWREYIQTLPTDSLFNLGADETLEIPIECDRALLCYMTAISRAEHQRTDTAAMKAIAKSYINTAHIYSSVYDDLAEAYVNLRKAEEICVAYGFRSILAHTYLNIGATLSVAGMIKPDNIRRPGKERGDTYLTKAFRMARETGNHEVMAYSLYNLTDNWLLERPDSLIKYLDAYIEEDIPDTEKTRTYYLTIARGAKAFIENDTEAAIGYFRSLSSIPVPLHSVEPYTRDFGDFMIALCREKEGDSVQAARIMNRIFDNSRQRKDLETEIWIAIQLYLFHTRHNTPGNLADTYLLAYYNAREALAISDDSPSTISELDLRQSLSDYEKELTVKRLEARRDRSIIIIGASVCMLIISLLLLLLWMSRKRRHYIQTLYEKNRQIDSALASAASSAGMPSEQTPAGEKNETKAETSEADSREAALGLRIADYLSSSREIFNPDFQLSHVCTEVGSNTTYVSQALNRHYGKPFKTVLAELRVNEARRLLDDPDTNARYTIEAICHEVGFKSRAAFSVAFKGITGLTPTEYRNVARRYMPQA